MSCAAFCSNRRRAWSIWAAAASSTGDPEGAPRIRGPTRSANISRTTPESSTSNATYNTGAWQTIRCERTPTQVRLLINGVVVKQISKRVTMGDRVLVTTLTKKMA